VALTTQTPFIAVVKEKVEIPVLPLWAFVACSRVNFTFTATNHRNLFPKTTVIP
jgi:hypothetical protein